MSGPNLQQLIISSLVRNTQVPPDEWLRLTLREIGVKLNKNPEEIKKIRTYLCDVSFKKVLWIFQHTRRVLREFCITDQFSIKNQQMDLKPKKLYSLGYNLLFNVIAIPNVAFFISIAEFVDACGIPQLILLFNGVSLRGFLLVLIHLTLNLCIYQFTVNFVITFCAPYITFILIIILKPLSA